MLEATCMWSTYAITATLLLAEQTSLRPFSLLCLCLQGPGAHLPKQVKSGIDGGFIMCS